MTKRAACALRGVPAVLSRDADPVRVNDIWRQREIDVLRQQEKDKTLHNSVGDVAVYQIQSEPVIHAGLKTQVYRQTIAHFDGRLPAGVVRQLVDATIYRESLMREEIAAYRRAQKAKRQARRRA